MCGETRRGGVYKYICGYIGYNYKTAAEAARLCSVKHDTGAAQHSQNIQGVAL